MYFTGDNMKLSQKAFEDLKTILEKEIGIEKVKEMEEVGIQSFGIFLLTIASTSLKIKMRTNQKELSHCQTNTS